MDDGDTRGEDHVANPRVQVHVVANPKQPNKFHFNEQVSKIKENIRKAEAERGSLGNRISIKKDKLRNRVATKIFRRFSEGSVKDLQYQFFL